MSGEIYRWEQALGFGDMDPAGILYYPRFLHFCHLSFEGFMAEVLGFSYAELIADHRRGFPAVHVEVDYRRPLAYGETLHMAVTTMAVGTRSLHLAYEAGIGGEAVHARAEVKTVHVDMDAFSSVDIPDELRAALNRFSA